MRAVFFSALCLAAPALAQPPVGALAIDERQGDRYGWAVDYETAAAARDAALRECGAACSVVLDFERCGAYAADQDADSTAVGWAESCDSADVARQAALSECGSRGGDGHWVLRNANGTVGEGPYVAGKQTGHWVIREPDGDVGEGPMVDGRPHGPWVYRWRSGDVSDLEFVNGEVVSSRFR